MKLSCRMLMLYNKRFGRLTALEVVGKSKYGYLWKCLCDCGNERTIVASKLISGNSKSCGCLRDDIARQRMKDMSESRRVNSKLYSLHYTYNNYKNRAVKDGRDFSITFEEFEKITSSPCYYCGRNGVNVFTKYSSRHLHTPYYYNGVDRIINSKGYILENCVPCCKDCNRAKRAMSEDEFLNLINLIYDNRIKKSI